MKNNNENMGHGFIDLQYLPTIKNVRSDNTFV